jgi:two-component system OmpR family response regulator
MNILAVEDEPSLAGHVVRALKRAGHEITHAADGPAGLKEALAGRFDIVVLDVNLPGMDGFEVLKRVRKSGCSARVLMLTARGEIGDRVLGLKAGADDYLTKPFAMEELLARVEALGRRGVPVEQADRLRCGDLSMDVRARKVNIAGEPVALSPREMEVLQILLAEPGRTFSRDEICERIWQREHEYDTRTVEIFIMRLRRKLEGGGQTPVIETVRGAGYRLHPV